MDRPLSLSIRRWLSARTGIMSQCPGIVRGSLYKSDENKAASTSSEKRLYVQQIRVIRDLLIED
jgi:hypothetical protein